MKNVRIRLLLAVTVGLLLFAPLGKLGAQGGHSITLTWTNPSTGTPATSVDILRGTTAGGESATPIANVPAPGTTFVDATGTAGVTYFYKVVEKNQFGSAAPSNEVSALFVGDAPAPATALAAAAK